MNNTGAGGVSSNGIQNFEQLNFDPNQKMTPEQMQEMQRKMMAQMQLLQNNLMQMQGNTLMQENGIKVNGDGLKSSTGVVENETKKDEPEHSDILDERPLSELRESINNGEEIDEVDNPVNDSPIEKEMEQFKKAEAESKTTSIEEEKSEAEKFVENAAQKAHLKSETENYGFVGKIMSGLNPKKPGDSLELLDEARWKYLEGLYGRKFGAGLNGDSNKNGQVM